MLSMPYPSRLDSPLQLWRSARLARWLRGLRLNPARCAADATAAHGAVIQVHAIAEAAGARLGIYGDALQLADEEAAYRNEHGMTEFARALPHMTGIDMPDTWAIMTGPAGNSNISKYNVDPLQALAMSVGETCARAAVSIARGSACFTAHAVELRRTAVRIAAHPAHRPQPDEDHGPAINRAARRMEELGGRSLTARIRTTAHDLASSLSADMPCSGTELEQLRQHCAADLVQAIDVAISHITAQTKQAEKTSTSLATTASAVGRDARYYSQSPQAQEDTWPQRVAARLTEVEDCVNTSDFDAVRYAVGALMGMARWRDDNRPVAAGAVRAAQSCAGAAAEATTVETEPGGTRGTPAVLRTTHATRPPHLHGLAPHLQGLAPQVPSPAEVLRATIAEIRLSDGAQLTLNPGCERLSEAYHTYRAFLAHGSYHGTTHSVGSIYRAVAGMICDASGASYSDAEHTWAADIIPWVMRARDAEREDPSMADLDRLMAFLQDYSVRQAEQGEWWRRLSPAAPRKYKARLVVTDDAPGGSGNDSDGPPPTLIAVETAHARVARVTVAGTGDRRGPRDRQVERIVEAPARHA